MLLRQRFTRSGRAKGSGVSCMRRILDLFSLRADLRLDLAVARAEIAPAVGRQTGKRHMSAHSSVDRRKPLDVDSTQRMRALTPTELYDSHRPKCYAVQLVVSDRPVNLDMMPRLEVFAAHRLYTIAAKQENGTWHALRLGFFPDEESAQVICGYLQTFFASPSIVRVSTAEQARFAPPSASASTCLGADRLRRQSPRQATDAKSDSCHRAREGANENESPAEPGHQATQDARRRIARRSARATAFPQRPEPCSGAKRLVAHSSVRRSETAPALDLIVSTGRAAA